MRHIFIVNPHSGPQDATEQIKAKIALLPQRADCEVYVTAGTGDATRYVREVCRSTNDETHFYACGGDGTLNEVVNGAAGFAHAAVGCYPCGSGNDFVKYYGGKRFFLDLAAQMDGQCQPVDLIRVNDRYAINVVNLGFEAKTAARMVSFRRFPLLRGTRSYYAAVVVTLIDGLKNPCRIVEDGETLLDGKMLLATMDNGEYVGGSFRCAPRASVDDGWMETCVFTPISRLRFAKMIGLYQRGEHLEAPQLADCLTYRRTKQVEITAKKPFMICLDGEIVSGTRFEVTCVPQALRFIVPRGAVHTGKGIDMEAEKAL